MKKTKFQRGSIVTPQYLNELQVSSKFKEQSRVDYFSDPTAAEENLWELGSRDGIKDWEIDNSSNSALGRLAYSGRVLGVNRASAEIVFGPPSTTRFNSIRDENGAFLGLDSSSLLPTGSYGIIIEGGSMVSPLGDPWIWSRDYLIVNGGVTLFGIFHGLDQELKLVEDLPPRSLPFSLLFKITIDLSGNITELIDLRPHTHLDNLYNYTQSLNNTPIISSDYVASSWERILVDTRDAPLRIVLPDNSLSTNSDRIAIVDLFNNFQQNHLTIAPALNGTLENSTEDISFSDSGSTIELIFIRDEDSELSTWKLESEPTTRIKSDWNAEPGSISEILNKPILGTAAKLNTGTNIGDLIQLDSQRRLPAVDGSQLNNIQASNISGLSNTNGTVTNVGLSVPTGFVVSNSPITSSGTINLSYAVGYRGFTTGDKEKLDNITIGTSSGSLVQLDSQGRLPAIDGSQLTNINASNAVTSVSLSAPTGFVVSDSPITSSGTISLSYAQGYEPFTTAEKIKLSYIATGTEAGNFVQLDNNARLPAVDGSQLTNLPIDRPLYEKYRVSYNPLTPILTNTTYEAGTALDLDSSGFIKSNLYTIEGDQLNGYHGGVLAPNGKIYFMPRGIGNSDETPLGVLVLDPNDDSYVRIGPDFNTYNTGVVAQNGNIYCVSYTTNKQILVVNTQNNTVSNMTDSLGNTYTMGGHIGGCLAQNGMIYCAPLNNTQVLKIDPMANTASLIGDNSQLSGYGFISMILAPNGNLYSAPWISSSEPYVILEVIPATDQVNLIQFTPPTGEYPEYHGGVLAPNGKIYFVPIGNTQNSVSIMVLDVNNNNSIEFIGPGLIGYHGGVLAPNGRIYCIPRNTISGSVIEIDPETNTYKEFGSNLNGYIGGVLAPNGKIYCVPKTATNILVIDGVSDGEHWWALSNFVNKL